MTEFEKEVAKKIISIDYPEISDYLKMNDFQRIFVELFENEDISLYLVAFMYRAFETSGLGERFHHAKACLNLMKMER